MCIEKPPRHSVSVSLRFSSRKSRQPVSFRHYRRDEIAFKSDRRPCPYQPFRRRPAFPTRTIPACAPCRARCQQRLDELLPLSLILQTSTRGKLARNRPPIFHRIAVNDKPTVDARRRQTHVHKDHGQRRDGRRVPNTVSRWLIFGSRGAASTTCLCVRGHHPQLHRFRNRNMAMKILLQLQR